MDIFESPELGDTGHVCLPQLAGIQCSGIHPCIECRDFISLPIGTCRHNRPRLLMREVEHSHEGWDILVVELMA